MFERECTVYAFLLGYCRKLIEDIDDARFAEQPAAGINHPAWLLGHLTLATDYAAGLLGEPPVLRKTWYRDFGPGSKPMPQRDLYPSKDALFTALEAGHLRIDKAARSAEASAMGQPHGLDIADFQTTLPTKADLLAHLMTSHEAMHLGHLSNWRRQIGLPYLF